MFVVENTKAIWPGGSGMFRALDRRDDVLTLKRWKLRERAVAVEISFDLPRQPTGLVNPNVRVLNVESTSNRFGFRIKPLSEPDGLIGGG